MTFSNDCARAKDYTFGFVRGIGEYYADKFKGTEGVKDAISRTGSIMDEGFEIMDDYNPINFIKDPVKNLSKKIDEKVSDGNSETMTVGEKLWNGTKGVGSVVDNLTTAKGLTVACLTVGTGGMAASGFAAIAPTAASALAPVATAATATGGSILVGKGTYDIATAENEADAQKGGAEIGVGGLMITGAAISAKGSLEAARQVGVPAADPSTMNTAQALVENFRVAPKALGIATGLSEPVPGVLIPATAYRMESKPNQVEAYKTTGKPDGIVYEKDGKLFVPNKWNPESPYKVSKDSIIMKYGDDDFAVCDPKIFQKTYVNDASGKYAKVNQMKPGEVMHATKKAVGGFEFAKPGTEVKTLEGKVTLKEGQAILYDVDGNPYVGDIEKSLLKRNVPVGPKAEEQFAKLNNPTKQLTIVETDGSVRAATKAELYNSIVNEQPLNRHAY